MSHPGTEFRQEFSMFLSQVTHKVAGGSNMRVLDVNNLLKRFCETQSVMKKLSGGGHDHAAARGR